MHAEVYATPFLDSSIAATAVTVSPVLTVSLAPPPASAESAGLMLVISSYIG